SYLRPITPCSQGIYLGQASTTSSGIEMVASGETTIDFSTLGIYYKGRIQYNNTTNALSFFTNSSVTASLVLTDSTTVNTINCNNFEPTTMNTDMIIKANTVLFGDTLTHTSLSRSSSNVYSEAIFINILRAKNGFVSGYDNEVGLFTYTFTVSTTGNGYISGHFYCGGLLPAPNIYNKTQVDNLLTGKQNTLIFRDRTQLNPP
ncbi:MAG: hypothetical protein ACKPKO_40050, partial [Candidatus Fonsibacter sp.]